MASLQKIAVVTGGNKGIGFAICKGLAVLPGYHVVLASRDLERGSRAIAELSKAGITNVEAEQLDVSDADSIKAFAQRVLHKHGRVDVLVNNAGIFPEIGVSVLKADPASVLTTFHTNTLGPLQLIQAFVPGMVERNYGRVVNVSSGAGQLSDMNGRHPGYRVSKVSLNALTRIVADEFKSANLLVNSICPGYVRTDMTGGESSRSTRTPEEGADTAIWAATLPDDGPRGGFFRNRMPIPW